VQPFLPLKAPNKLIMHFATMTVFQFSGFTCRDLLKGMWP